MNKNRNNFHYKILIQILFNMILCKRVLFNTIKNYIKNYINKNYLIDQKQFK